MPGHDRVGLQAGAGSDHVGDGRVATFFVRMEQSRARVTNHPGHSSQKSHGRKGGGDGEVVEGRDALDVPPANLETGRGLNARQAEALNEYLENSTAINDWLRENPDERELPLEVQRIDKALRNSELPQPIRVYRGVPPAALGGLDGDLVGREWRDPGYSSTSPDPRVAEAATRYNGGVVLEMVLPVGTRAATLEVTDREAGRREPGEPQFNEILAQRGLGFRVTGERAPGEGEGSTRIITVEVLPA